MKHLIGKRVRVIDPSHPHYGETAKAVSVDILKILQVEALKCESDESAFYVRNEKQIQVVK